MEQTWKWFEEEMESIKYKSSWDKYIGKRVALDTPCFVHLFESHPKYAQALMALFELIEGGKIEGITSSLSLFEVLSKPLSVGAVEIAEEYKVRLLHFPNLLILPFRHEMAEVGASLLASYSGLLFGDAIQLATAVVEKANCFVSDKKGLPNIKNLKIVDLNKV